MFFIQIFLVFQVVLTGFSSFACECGRSSDYSVGPLSTAKRHPWLGKILVEGCQVKVCTGILVSPRHVLTTCPCDLSSRFQVHLGLSDLDDEDFGIFDNPLGNYKYFELDGKNVKRVFQFDLIELPASMDRIDPVCLSTTIPDMNNMIAAYWSFPDSGLILQDKISKLYKFARLEAFHLDKDMDKKIEIGTPVLQENKGRWYFVAIKMASVMENVKTESMWHAEGIKNGYPLMSQFKEELEKLGVCYKG